MLIFSLWSCESNWRNNENFPCKMFHWWMNFDESYSAIHRCNRYCSTWLLIHIISVIGIEEFFEFSVESLQRSTFQIKFNFELSLKAVSWKCTRDYRHYFILIRFFSSLIFFFFFFYLFSKTHLYCTTDSTSKHFLGRPIVWCQIRYYRLMFTLVLFLVCGM